MLLLQYILIVHMYPLSLQHPRASEGVLINCLQLNQDMDDCLQFITSILYIVLAAGGVLAQFSQFKMVSMRSEKPIGAPPCLSEVSPNVSFETVPFGSSD